MIFYVGGSVIYLPEKGGLMKRQSLEKQVLSHVVEAVDAAALGGRDIRSADLDERLFDARPEAHSANIQEVRSLYDGLTASARADNRLPVGEQLVKRWTLSWDIFCPSLGRFIEVDERQHFSRVRLERIRKTQPENWAPEYPSYFWEHVFDDRLKSPSRDLDPPHRDEQRAYLDEMRDRLPCLYGLGRTVRVDAFTLKEKGLGVLNGLIAELM